MTPYLELHLVDLSNSLAEKLDYTTVENSSTSIHRCVRQPAERARGPRPGAERGPGRQPRADDQRLRLPAPPLASRRRGHAPHRPGQRAEPLSLGHHATAG